MDDILVPEFLDKVCDHITSGGSLPNLCTGLNISYAKVTRWLYEDPARKQSYELALRDRNEWYVQSILDELRSIGLSDIRKAYDPTTGQLLDVSSMPADISKTIAAVESSEVDGTKRIKLWDKLRALELLGKNLKMFKEQIEHTGTMTLEDLVTQSMLPEPEPEPKELPAP